MTSPSKLYALNICSSPNGTHIFCHLQGLKSLEAIFVSLKNFGFPFCKLFLNLHEFCTSDLHATLWKHSLIPPIRCLILNGMSLSIILTYGLFKSHLRDTLLKCKNIFLISCAEKSASLSPHICFCFAVIPSRLNSL